MKYDECRKKIDNIDAQIVELLNARARLARTIGTIKATAGMPIVDREREATVFRYIAERNEGVLTDDSMASIYREIIRASRHVQRDASFAARCEVGETAT